MSLQPTLTYSPGEKIYDADTSLKNRFFEHIANKLVLDVGCGTGSLGKFLSDRSNACIGITISEIEAIEARKVMSEVLVGDIERLATLPYAEHSFDVIILADVLEHLKDPWAVARSLLKYLKPDGQVIASIPNVTNILIRRDILFGRFKYQESGILDSTHLRFFDTVSARELFTRTGYEIIAVRHSSWNWNLPRIFRILPKQIQFALKDRLTELIPGLLATQFVVYARSPLNTQ